MSLSCCKPPAIQLVGGESGARVSRSMRGSVSRWYPGQASPGKKIKGGSGGGVVGGLPLYTLTKKILCAWALGCKQSVQRFPAGANGYCRPRASSRARSRPASPSWSRRSPRTTSPGLFKWKNYDSTGGRGHSRPACLPTIFSYCFSQDLLKIS